MSTLDAVAGWSTATQPAAGYAGKPLAVNDKATYPEMLAMVTSPVTITAARRRRRLPMWLVLRVGFTSCMVGLEVVSADCVAKRSEVASLGLRAPYEALDGRAEERPGAARWLQQAQGGTEFTVSGAPSQVEQDLDYPPTSETSP